MLQRQLVLLTQRLALSESRLQQVESVIINWVTHMREQAAVDKVSQPACSNQQPVPTLSFAVGQQLALPGPIPPVSHKRLRPNNVQGLTLQVLQLILGGLMRPGAL